MVRKKYTKQQELMLHWYKDNKEGAKARELLGGMHPEYFKDDTR